jgi:ribosome biogenesis GTPase A
MFCIMLFSDLVPKIVIQKWLTYLRNEFPTIAFKCSTQKQRKKIGQKKGKKTNKILIFLIIKLFENNSTIND